MGNAGTFRQFPIIFRSNPRQAAGVIGWTAAIAAYGPFIFSVAIDGMSAAYGSPAPFFYGLTVFFIFATAVNWWFYARKGAREFLCLESEKINYRLPEPFGMLDRTFAPGEKAVINLSSPISNGKIYYTENGEPPTRGSIPYRGSFVLKNLSPGTSVTIRAIVVSSSDRQSAVGTCTYARLSDPRPAPVQRRPNIPPTLPTRSPS